jgi:hypothetical protein
MKLGDSINNKLGDDSKNNKLGDDSINNRKVKNR